MGKHAFNIFINSERFQQSYAVVSPTTMMEVVDSHYHLWSPEKDPWLQQVDGVQPGKLDFSKIAKPFDDQQHLKLLEAAGLTCHRAVFVQVVELFVEVNVETIKIPHVPTPHHPQCGWHTGGKDPVGETQWASQQGPLPTAVVGYADLDKPDVAKDQLARHKQWPRFRGIRFMLDWDPDRPGIRQTTRGDWYEVRCV